MTDTSFILWLQQFSNGFLDVFFTYVTKLGNPEYYMVAIPLFYWCINKKEAFRFTMFFLMSTYINSVIKASTAIQRPSGDEVRILYQESTLGTSSFPSGHTQGTASFWGYIAYYLKNKTFTLIATTIIVLVGLSRMYLGLHFPIDVIGGLLFAFGILVLFNKFYDSTVQKLTKLSFTTKILLSTIVPLLFLILPGLDKGMLVGFVIGLLVGYQIEGRSLGFQTQATLGKQVAKFVIGITGFFGLRILLKALFVEVGLSNMTILGADVLRYCIIGLWAAYFAPLVFVKLGLSKATGSIAKTPIHKSPMGKAIKTR